MEAVIVRTNSSNKDFVHLVSLLDADLAERDGAEHGFYHAFNAIDSLQYVVVLYENDVAVSCGAIKPIAPGSMEVKRMYCLPVARRKGFAIAVLKALEKWASEMGYSACVLETGKKQPEAIALYHKAGYTIIPNYGQYAGVENSVCFKKIIS